MRSLWISSETPKKVSSNLISLLLSNWPGKLGWVVKKFKRMRGLLFGVDFFGVAFIDRNVPMSILYHVYTTVMSTWQLIMLTWASSFTSKETLTGINLLFETLSSHLFRRQSPVFKHASQAHEQFMKKIQRKLMFNECWKSGWKLLIFASLISPSKILLLETKYQAFDTVFHHQKFVKNTRLRVVFSTLFFAVCHLVIKHCASCLVYYVITT